MTSQYPPNDAGRSAAPGSHLIVQKFLDTLRRTQFLPPQKMRDYQRALLTPLLRHARDNVPFYRDSGRLAPLFRADDSIDWDRWRDIPPLTRGELQREFERLKAESLPANHGRLFLLSTSGSTGEPAKVIHTELAIRWAWAALRLRDFEWHQIDPTRRLAYLYPFTYDDFDITGTHTRRGWRPEYIPLNMAGVRVDIADTRPATELVETVASVRPAYLQVQPTALQLMLACDHKNLLADLKLAAVFTHGEHVSHEFKHHVESRLRCKLFDLYGSTECNYFACTCPKCGNFHVHSETVLVEAIDESGNDVPAGEVGRLLVTPLYSYAMPLIRYDHNDFARLAADECTVKLQSFAEIIGKNRDPFIFPDGRTIRPTPPTDAIIKFLGAQTVQIAQTGPDRCEFRIMPGSLHPSRMQFDAMTNFVRRIWWEGLQVDYRIVEGFTRQSPRAKFQMIKQEFFNPSDYLGKLSKPAGETS